VSFLSGELQHISQLCQESPFSKILAIPASVSVETTILLLGSSAASSPSMSVSVPENQFISNEVVVAAAI